MRKHDEEWTKKIQNDLSIPKNGIGYFFEFLKFIQRIMRLDGVFFELEKISVRNWYYRQFVLYLNLRVIISFTK